MGYVEDVRLVRTDEHTDEIEALAASVARRVPLARLLDDLDRRGRRTWLPLRGLERAYTFAPADRRDRRWWPQGVTTSADADETERVAGRRLVLVSWYAKKLPGDAASHGSRVTVFDLDSRRYRHVLLVVPTVEDGSARLKPLAVHAGGIVWHGDHLHVAATGRGLHTFRLGDLMRVADDRPPVHGHRYVLPVRFSYRAETAEDHEPFRYSFISLDRTGPTPAVLAGEYGRGRGRSRRLARFPLDPDTRLLSEAEGPARPSELHEGVRQMQGVAAARGRLHLTVSHGPWTPGSVYVGVPGAFVRHKYATPMGPEDLSYWPSTDSLWSVSEHPRRRWIFALRRSVFDRPGRDPGAAR